MKPMVRVAVAQLAPVFLDAAGTIDKIARTLAEAARSGAELVAFPECFLPGYPYFAMVHAPVALGPYLARLHAEALVIPSPKLELLAAAVKAAGVHAALGVVERDGGTLYNTQLFFSPDGALIGRRRKLTPTSHERLVFGAGDGRDLFVLDTPLGRLGGLVCYEHAHALIRYAICSEREEIHVAAWPGGMRSILGIVDAASRHYAFETQCFVLAAGGVLTDEIIAACGAEASVLKPAGGGSAIIAPRGDVLAGPAGDDEEILHAELDPRLIVNLKTVVDTVGHYSRPDVLRLVIERGR